MGTSLVTSWLRVVGKAACINIVLCEAKVGIREMATTSSSLPQW